MHMLQDKVMSPSVLALPYGGGQFTLDTDACNVQIGCVLLQDQPDQTKRPVDYWSRSLTSAKRAYDTTHKECLAIVWAVLLICPYLEGTKFTIRTDHDSLRSILNIIDATGRLARWELRLSEFEYDAVHRAGIKNQAADALYRLPTTGHDITPLDDDIPVALVENNDTSTVYALELDLPADPVDVRAELAQLQPPRLEEFGKAQADDPFYQNVAKEIGYQNTEFTTN